MFENVGRPGAFLDAAQKAAAFAVAAAVLDERRQHLFQAFVVTGNLVGGEVFEFADIDDGFQDRAVGPDIRAAQVADFKKLDVFGFRIHGIGKFGEQRIMARITQCVVFG